MQQNKEAPDDSLIRNVPEAVFRNSNVFIYSANKFICSASVPFIADILTVSQC